MRTLATAGLVMAALACGLNDAKAGLFHHRRGGGCSGGGAGYASGGCSGGGMAYSYGGGCSGSYGGYGYGGYGAGKASVGISAVSIGGSVYTWGGSYDSLGNPIMIAAAGQGVQQQGQGRAVGQRLPSSTAPQGGGGEASEGLQRQPYAPGSVWIADEKGVLRPYKKNGKKEE